ncbi:hypothetical protein GN244_ATG11462 [Phytophthora infestans]|uniref:Secreted RxLR effector peptide protein n=1 Tax=Phytophthora infestans TaxID=4787 RepID=A0A833S037_PHYIN|nr:hypothetical protein GN244_ATG11462 [Phytophthora infestans]KAF4128718.1 hypothetical protein GN958_ATG22140 [Phytophthora infestans]KAI9986737.1 hypothetical protein PInf_025694 [Phytophthora infestans]
MCRQRRARTAAIAVSLLLGAVGYVAALPTQTSETEFQIAEAFETTSNENETTLLDDVVVSASLESEKTVPPPAEMKPRDLRPVKASTTEHHTESHSLTLPYGGALVAVEATALLVGGATIAVLAISKIKSRATTIQYDYDRDHIDPMLQSLLYSDMDYAAI